MAFFYLDGRSDLFSLAVVAYELIIGQPAFYAQTVPDVLVRIAADHPAPFSKYFGAIDPALRVLRGEKKPPLCVLGVLLVKYTIQNHGVVQRDLIRRKKNSIM